MKALQAAQSVYEATIARLGGIEVELDPMDAIAIATYCATLAQAEEMHLTRVAAERQAAALERIAKSLCMDNDLTVIDALYALVEAVGGQQPDSAPSGPPLDDDDPALADYHYRKAQAQAYMKAERGE